MVAPILAAFAGAGELGTLLHYCDAEAGLGQISSSPVLLEARGVEPLAMVAGSEAVLPAFALPILPAQTQIVPIELRANCKAA